MDLEANDQLEPSSQNLSTVIALRPTPMCYATPTRRATPHPVLCKRPQLQHHTERGARYLPLRICPARRGASICTDH
jgi:hypothetical protein